jgi:hypothetical protein
VICSKRVAIEDDMEANNRRARIPTALKVSLAVRQTELICIPSMVCSGQIAETALDDIGNHNRRLGPGKGYLPLIKYLSELYREFGPSNPEK